MVEMILVEDGISSGDAFSHVMHIWLGVWNMLFFPPYIWNVRIPN
jgi:hypothetical protein